MSNTVLEIKNLSKSFGSKKILDDVNLFVYEGEIFGFLGPNGCGKTTTIKLILGLLKITHGEIYIDGKNVNDDFENAISKVGGIIENPEMYSYLTPIENLRQFARMYNVDVSDERINEVIDIVGMSDYKNVKLAKFSLGMRQRIGLAQAILHKPKLIVLDEPTNGLDPAGIKDLRDTLKKLCHEENVSVFISSHQLAELELLCDRVGIVNHGTVVGVRTMEELHSEKDGASIIDVAVDNKESALSVLQENEIDASDKSENVISVRTQHENIPNVVSILVNNKIAIYGVNEEKHTLEEAFLEMTEDLKTASQNKEGK